MELKLPFSFKLRIELAISVFLAKMSQDFKEHQIREKASENIDTFTIEEAVSNNLISIDEITNIFKKELEHNLKIFIWAAKQNKTKTK